ncbi:MAG: Biopolymer transport protein ExbD/TolR [Myxococcales bacterium]|nr:Biopolymer transport protein ExbD/TolR [Myxococcales bacterium]
MAGGMDAFGRPQLKQRRRAKIHRKREGSIRPGSTKNEINVTPLVDVVLVLLIIFMVVTPMLHRGVHIELPVTEHHDKKQDTGEQLVVTIRADGTFIETDKIPDEALIERVKKELKTSRPVHVRADKSLPYGDVRKVLEKIHEAGAQNVAMGTEEAK